MQNPTPRRPSNRQPVRQSVQSHLTRPIVPQQTLRRPPRKRKRLSLAVRVLIILIVTAAAVLALAKGARYAIDRAEHIAYPLPDEYRAMIAEYAELYDIPSEMICAVILTESSFNHDAVSHAGAAGLMQITEDTFLWLSSKLGEDAAEDTRLDPETSIRYGSFFLSMLYEEFGHWQTALAAYNAGPTRVRGWLRDGTVQTQDEQLTGIPINETASYVIKVTAASEKYKQLYYNNGEN